MVRKTPLFDAHVQHCGKMVEFAGWTLPVQYKGVIAECQSVRSSVGMFDVSHMARLKFSGLGALEFLEFVTTNDVERLEVGQGHYSLLPNSTGGCVDDIVLYRTSGSEFKMVVNAANHEKDVTHFRSHLTPDVDLTDYSAQTAMIAVQGPQAEVLVSALSDSPNELLSLPLFGSTECKVAGIKVFAARSGYTGEDGYELQCDAENAEALWDKLAEAGAVPCGLGSRDVLRVEAGLPLYGHELSDSLSPISAGLGWVVSRTKSFLGSEHINSARAAGTPTKLQGLQLEGKRLVTPGADVYAGHRIGEVTSGVYSPLLECGIAFAFLDAEIKQGSACEVDVRGSRVHATVVNKRFFKR